MLKGANPTVLSVAIISLLSLHFTAAKVRAQNGIDSLEWTVADSDLIVRGQFVADDNAAPVTSIDHRPDPSALVFEVAETLKGPSLKHIHCLNLSVQPTFGQFQLIPRSNELLLFLKRVLPNVDGVCITTLSIDFDEKPETSPLRLLTQSPFDATPFTLFDMNCDMIPRRSVRTAVRDIVSQEPSEPSRSVLRTRRCISMYGYPTAIMRVPVDRRLEGPAQAVLRDYFAGLTQNSFFYLDPAFVHDLGLFPSRENAALLRSALSSDLNIGAVGFDRDHSTIYQARDEPYAILKAWGDSPPPTEVVLPDDRYQYIGNHVMLGALAMVVIFMILRIALCSQAIVAVACVATMFVVAGMWHRSRTRSDDLVLESTTQQYWLASCESRIQIGWWPHTPTSQPRAQWLPNAPTPWATPDRVVCPPRRMQLASFEQNECPELFKCDGPHTLFDRAGVTVISGATAPFSRNNVPHAYNRIDIHYALLMGLAPLPLLAPLKRLTQRRRRKRRGLCINCGYDMRATKNLCPECRTQSA